MGIEITGVLHTIFPTAQVSERFTKREFTLELRDNPKYPQIVLFQLTGDRISQLDDLRVGDSCRVEFSLRGREWRSPKGETKYFNSLDVWRIESLVPSNRPAPSGGGYLGADPDPYNPDNPDNKLPFAHCTSLDNTSPRMWRRNP